MLEEVLVETIKGQECVEIYEGSSSANIIRRREDGGKSVEKAREKQIMMSQCMLIDEIKSKKSGLIQKRLNMPQVVKSNKY